MAAPLLGSAWQIHLGSLEPGWDGADGKPISREAMLTVERFSAVPCSDGGIQLEVHRDGFDIEIVISGEGKITSALVCAEPQ